MSSIVTPPHRRRSVNGITDDSVQLGLPTVTSDLITSEKTAKMELNCHRVLCTITVKCAQNKEKVESI